MNIHGAHSYWKQGALAASGVRRVWAGAGPRRVAYRGGGYCAASRTACYFLLRQNGSTVIYIKDIQKYINTIHNIQTERQIRQYRRNIVLNFQQVGSQKNVDKKLSAIADKPRDACVCTICYGVAHLQTHPARTRAARPTSIILG